MLDVRLFGEFKVTLDNQPIEIPARAMQSLLAHLILNAGTAYRREKLAGLFWPESDEKNARHNLRQTLWRLGKAIGKDYFLTDKVSVGFNPQAEYRLDVAVLQDKAAEWNMTDQLVRSVSVYTDVLLPGFYDDWVLLEQERLQSIYEDRMQMLLDRLIHEGRWRETREWAEIWIAHGHVPEAAYRALMVAHAGLGDQAGVKAVYQRCVDALEEEIGVEPSPETQSLFQRINAGQDLPELQSKNSKPPSKVKLPLQPNPFIGRKNDLKELVALLTDPTIRLVNILGPGGIGKTRLAIEAARAQSDAFMDGIYFVSLAPLDDPNLIATPIANAINFIFLVQDQREKAGKNPQNQQLLAYLGDKQMMLVLDNLEHLLAGLPLIADILRFAPDVKILTTSRQRLGLRGETVYTVGNMLVPEKINKEDSVIVEDYDALQLFVHCAQRTQPRFDLRSDNLEDVITVCHLVDGLPLGIELAAAWVGLLTPQEIAAEIKTSLDFLSSNYHDMPDRQQSMRSVFESSWNRLTEIEKEVFQRLSVFRGGFTRPAAESVAGANLQMLMTLVNKSLIQPDYTGRYHVHELLRQFGSEKLRDANNEKPTRDQHQDYFLELAQESEPKLQGEEQAAWMEKLDAERANFRIALDWSLKAGKAENGMRLAAALGQFWHMHSQQVSEGREWLEKILSVVGSTKQKMVQAKAFRWLGRLSFYQGDNTMARSAYEKSLALYQELEDKGGIAESHFILAELTMYQGDIAMAYSHYEAARLNMEQNLVDLRAGDDEWRVARTLILLGEIARTEGDYDGARAFYEESLAIRRGLDDEWGVANSLHNLAYVASYQKEYRLAITLIEQCLVTWQKMGMKRGVINCIWIFAGVAVGIGRPKRAVRLFAAAESLLDKEHFRLEYVDRRDVDRYISKVHDQLEEVDFAIAWAEGQAMTLEQTINYALAVEPDQLGVAK